MFFQRLIWAALASALLVASVQTGVQQWQAVPIILAAEAYEGDKVEAPASMSAPASITATTGTTGTTAGHVHAEGAAAHEHGHAAKEWSPAEGAERIFWTWVANLLHAFSMALLVFAAMGVCIWRGSAMRSMPMALLVAAAGWLSFHFWPSLGLQAEIPGMDAARLGSRQGWWVLAAGSAALAAISMAGLRSVPMRLMAAAAWLALPFVVGAPHIAADPLAGFSDPAQSTLRELGRQFVWATTWVSLSFWLSMGVVCAVAFQRLLRPVLQSTFERGAAASADATQAVNS